MLSGASTFLEADGLWGCYHYLSYLNEPTAHWFRSQWGPDRLGIVREEKQLTVPVVKHNFDINLSSRPPGLSDLVRQLCQIIETCSLFLLFSVFVSHARCTVCSSG